MYSVQVGSCTTWCGCLLWTFIYCKWLTSSLLNHYMPRLVFFFFRSNIFLKRYLVQPRQQQCFCSACPSCHRTYFTFLFLASFIATIRSLSLIEMEHKAIPFLNPRAFQRFKVHWRSGHTVDTVLPLSFTVHLISSLYFPFCFVIYLTCTEVQS